MSILNSSWASINPRKSQKYLGAYIWRFPEVHIQNKYSLSSFETTTLHSQLLRPSLHSSVWCVSCRNYLSPNGRCEDGHSTEVIPAQIGLYILLLSWCKMRGLIRRSPWPGLTMTGQNRTRSTLYLLHSYLNEARQLQSVSQHTEFPHLRFAPAFSERSRSSE